METIWAEHSTSLPNLIGRVTHKTHAEIKFIETTSGFKSLSPNEKYSKKPLGEIKVLSR